MEASCGYLIPVMMLPFDDPFYFSARSDQGEEGGDQLIADIFGASDEEEEEFEVRGLSEIVVLRIIKQKVQSYTCLIKTPLPLEVFKLSFMFIFFCLFASGIVRWAGEKKEL